MRMVTLACSCLDKRRKKRPAMTEVRNSVSTVPPSGQISMFAPVSPCVQLSVRLQAEMSEI